jgi:hypothetical protein
MGVQHAGIPDNRSIYQPLLDAAPVLSLAAQSFLARQRQQSVEKKPTALPRWVFISCNLKLS